MPDKVSGWEHVSLSEPNSVKGLLGFRSEFDPTFNIDNRILLEAGTDLANVNQDIHNTYIDLQIVLDKTKLTGRQKEVVELYQKGLGLGEVGEILDIDPYTVDIIIDTACINISNMNKEIWSQDFIHWDRKKVNTKYKQCSKCKEFKPKTTKYYRIRKGTKDGLMYICRLCE